jgi:hypothetical protein
MMSQTELVLEMIIFFVLLFQSVGLQAEEVYRNNTELKTPISTKSGGLQSGKEFSLGKPLLSVKIGGVKHLLLFEKGNLLLSSQCLWRFRID